MAFADRPQFGIYSFPTDYAMQPVALARAVEERGFDSLFFPEHTHIPASRRTPYPAGGEMPRMYWHGHDPLIALAACASVTQRIRLGTGICLVAQRDPIVMAKEVASLDVISNGRIVLGIGAGWNREEMENHGVRFADRWKIAREKVLAMREIWTKDEPEFHGDFVNFDPIWLYPKPIQSGGPPVWLGSLTSRWVFDRIAEYGDGWIPIGGIEPNDLERLSDALERRSRKLVDIDLILYQAPQDYDQIMRAREQGFDEFVFNVDDASAEEVVPKLDQLIALVEKARA